MLASVAVSSCCCSGSGYNKRSFRNELNDGKLISALAGGGTQDPVRELPESIAEIERKMLSARSNWFGVTTKPVNKFRSCIKAALRLLGN